MHRKILREEKWRWYVNDIFLPPDANFANCARILQMILEQIWNELSQLVDRDFVQHINTVSRHHFRK